MQVFDRFWLPVDSLVLDMRNVDRVGEERVVYNFRTLRRVYIYFEITIECNKYYLPTARIRPLGLMIW